MRRKRSSKPLLVAAAACLALYVLNSEHAHLSAVRQQRVALYALCLVSLTCFLVGCFRLKHVDQVIGGDLCV
jgi:hypothetical protein